MWRDKDFLRVWATLGYSILFHITEGNGLSCQSNITSSEGILAVNDCHLDPDIIGYDCTVKYLGNVAPVLEWSYGETRNPINKTKSLSTNKNNTLFSTNQFSETATRELNGTYYVCRIRNVESKNGRNNTCSTTVVNILSRWSKRLTCHYNW